MTQEIETLIQTVNSGDLPREACNVLRLLLNGAGPDCKIPQEERTALYQALTPSIKEFLEGTVNVLVKGGMVPAQALATAAGEGNFMYSARLRKGVVTLKGLTYNIRIDPKTGFWAVDKG